jgi:hypothetical protein
VVGLAQIDPQEYPEIEVEEHRRSSYATDDDSAGKKGGELHIHGGVQWIWRPERA